MAEIPTLECKKTIKTFKNIAIAASTHFSVLSQASGYQETAGNSYVVHPALRHAEVHDKCPPHITTVVNCVKNALCNSLNHNSQLKNVNYLLCICRIQYAPHTNKRHATRHHHKKERLYEHEAEIK